MAARQMPPGQENSLTARTVKSHHPPVTSEAAKFHKGAGQSRVDPGERNGSSLNTSLASLAAPRGQGSFAAS